MSEVAWESGVDAAAASSSFSCSVGSAEGEARASPAASPLSARSCDLDEVAGTLWG